MVSFDDIYKLEPQVWLNDEIINFYMEMLSDRSKANPKEYLDIHCFSTFFYSTLSESGYKKVQRWTKRIDIFSKDLVLAPINQSLHWTLGVIDIRNKEVCVYDSLGGSHQRTLKILLDYVEQEHLDKKKTPIDISEWKMSAPKDIPHQKNMSDCGVFICMFAERLSRNHEMDFSQKDMSLIRRRMVLDISRKYIS
ncbi:hypothetical protein CLU79DRAFT_697775 [Phycomyces nitens]|nr:hypothetical protein CLU79DRAFT_697775 [Phycomyces nitens]